MEPEQPKIQPITTPLRIVPKKQLFTKFLPFIIIILLLSAGIFSGLILSSRSKNPVVSQAGIQEENLTPEQKQSLQVVTRDQAEGVIEKNDKFEETAQGQWKLIRPGGESQTAYLTSSFMDLDEFIGKKVKVFGETLGSEKVGWLMDVAKVEVIE